MKKYIASFICVSFLLMSTINYAHGGNISGYKEKNSEKIVEHQGEYYGYHKEDGETHYHKVKWDEENQRWQIKNSSIYYDKDFKNIKDNNAETKKVEVSLNRVIDGDTVAFNLIENGESITVRFLAIDTPESTKEIEPYGKEASNFTQDKLTNAKKIVLEYDNNSTETDKYNRQLAWIWIDDQLLQSLLIENGLAQVDYIYGDYKYVEELEEKEKTAKLNKVGMWQDAIQEETAVENIQNSTITNNTEYDNNLMFLVIIIMIILWIVKEINKKNNKKKKRK